MQTPAGSRRSNKPKSLSLQHYRHHFLLYADLKLAIFIFFYEKPKYLCINYVHVYSSKRRSRPVISHVLKKTHPFNLQIL